MSHPSILIDALFCEQEWLSLEELNNYGIIFKGNGWYKSPEEEWAYISQEGFEYLLTVWDYDPREHFVKIAGAEVR